MRGGRSSAGFLAVGFRLLFAAGIAAAACGRVWAAASVTEAKGIVQVAASSAREWRSVESLPHRLSDGDRVRTGTRAGAVVGFDDGSRVELGPHSSFAIEDSSPGRKLMRVDIGELTAFVRRSAGRKFQVRTPTAVASVRETEFRVSVLSGGRTTVELYKGLLGVEDNRGHQLLLRPNESLRIDQRGMSVPQRIPTKAQVRKESVHARIKREVGRDMGKEEVLAAAAREIKLSEYQLGKALVDVHGDRVRVEGYVLRPRADQFKLVVLNRRSERFDYFYYLGTFNKALPTDLGVAVRRLGGAVDAAAEFFLTGFETGRSNLTDTIHEIAQGGHVVDVNGNGVGSDDVSLFFDAGQDRFVDVSGRGVYETLFDRYGFYLNGRLKFGWSGTAVQARSEATEASVTDPITGAALTSANASLDGSGLLALRSKNVTYPDASRMHRRVHESYSDGSFVAWDNFSIDGEGRTAGLADFGGARSGSGYLEGLLGFNYEQVITASEFGGRKIDLVVGPKILIQSGLIP
ncbi:MAG: FecR family protein [Elusimicrobiota bacterium]